MHSIRLICEKNKTHLQSLNKLLTVLHPPPSSKLQPHNLKSEWRRKRRTGVWRRQERSARRSKSTEDDVVLCMAWCVVDMHLDFCFFFIGWFFKGWRAVVWWQRVPALHREANLPRLPPRLHARHRRHHPTVLRGSPDTKVRRKIFAIPIISLSLLLLASLMSDALGVTAV